MRESKPFGKRTTINSKPKPSDKVLKSVFGIVNDGCDSKQISDFIEKTTSHKISTKQ
jgi:hypothetical protein